jgi:hypothetical protein
MRSAGASENAAHDGARAALAGRNSRQLRAHAITGDGKCVTIELRLGRRPITSERLGALHEIAATTSVLDLAVDRGYARRTSPQNKLWTILSNDVLVWTA